MLCNATVSAMGCDNTVLHGAPSHLFFLATSSGPRRILELEHNLMN